MDKKAVKKTWWNDVKFRYREEFSGFPTKYMGHFDCCYSCWEATRRVDPRNVTHLGCRVLGKLTGGYGNVGATGICVNYHRNPSIVSER